jgi:hypothetical protein
MPVNKTSLRKSYQNQKYLKLVLSIALDLVGMATFVIPGVGEFADLIWAPIAGLAGFLMYGGLVGAVGGTFTFLEELLPGTDILPGLTLTWIVKFGLRDRQSFARYARKRGVEELPATQEESN